MDEIQGLKEAPDPLQLHDVNSYTGKAPSQVYEDHPEVLVGVPRLGKDLLALMTFFIFSQSPVAFCTREENRIGNLRLRRCLQGRFWIDT